MLSVGIDDTTGGSWLKSGDPASGDYAPAAPATGIATVSSSPNPQPDEESNVDAAWHAWTAIALSHAQDRHPYRAAWLTKHGREPPPFPE